MTILSLIGCAETDWKQLTFSNPIHIEWSTSESLHRMTGSVDGTQLWAVSEERIFHSKDAGQTWTSTAMPPARTISNELPRDAYTTPDGEVLWLTRGIEGLSKTDDGGATWEHIQLPGFDFLIDIHGSGDGANLWAIGLQSAYFSSDAGATWSERRIAPRNENLRIDFFEVVNSRTTIQSSENGTRVWAMQMSDKLLRSDDGGRTWESTTPTGGVKLQDVYANGEDLVWIVGTREERGTDKGVILRSDNGGVTWNTTAEFNFPLRSIHGSYSGREIVAIGDSSSLVYSDDRGQTWNEILDFPFDALRLYDAFIDDDGTAWIVGDNNTIVRSVGDFDSWEVQLQSPPRGESIHGVFGSADGRRLWAIGERSISNSTDFGRTWNKTNLPSRVWSNGDTGHRFFFGSKSSRLFAVDFDGIYMTDVGAASGWSKVSDEMGLVRLHGTSDSFHLWAVGSNGLILYSSDRGETWERQESPSRSPLHGIFSLEDGRHVWAVGNDGTILHSTDGGKDWNIQPSGSTDDLHSVFSVADGSRIWAVGRHGLVLHSSDRGKNWNRTTVDTESFLLEIDAASIGESIWVVATDGVIAHMPSVTSQWTRTTIPNRTLNGIFVPDDGAAVWLSTDSEVLRLDDLVVYPVVTAARVDYGSPEGVRVQVQIDPGEFTESEIDVALLGTNTFNAKKPEFGYSEISARRETDRNLVTFDNVNPNEQLGVSFGEIMHFGVRLSVGELSWVYEPIVEVSYDRFGRTRFQLLSLTSPVASVPILIVVAIMAALILWRRMYLARPKRFAKNEIEIAWNHMRSLYPPDEESAGVMSIDTDGLDQVGFRIGHWMNRANSEYGKSKLGDFYGWFPRKNGSLAVYTVDVDGHGLAASDMARTVFQLIEEVRDDKHCALMGAKAFLKEIDRRASNRHSFRNEQLSFCMNFAELGVNAEDRLGEHGGQSPRAPVEPNGSVPMLRYANSGMPAPIVFRCGSSIPDFLKATGVFLGRGYDRYFDPEEVVRELRLGDVLVFASDGLFDAASPRGVPFVSDGVISAAVTGLYKPPQEIVGLVVNAVQKHSKKDEPDDDQILVVIKAVEAQFRVEKLQTDSSFYFFVSRRLCPQIKAWAERHKLGAERCDRILISTKEAIINAYEHGTSIGDSLLVRVLSNGEGNSVLVGISQEQRWSDADVLFSESRQEKIRSCSEDVQGQHLRGSRGRMFGTTMMIRLSDKVTVRDGGRSVSMAFSRTATRQGTPEPNGG